VRDYAASFAGISNLVSDLSTVVYNASHNNTANKA
jgi:hypothetical protein